MRSFDPDKVQFSGNILSEPMVTVWNVMPEVTEKQLLTRLPGISRMHDGRQPNDNQIFTVDLQYGYGAGKQFLVLNPGEKRQLPKKMATEFMDRFREQGVVVLDGRQSEADARLQGLNDALAWLKTNGSERYTKHVLDMGYNEQQEKRNYHAMKNFHINMAKEDVVEESIETAMSGSISSEVDTAVDAQIASVIAKRRGRPANTKEVIA